MKMRDTIAAVPKLDNGRWRFTIADEVTQKRLDCVTGAGFVGNIPKMGTTVTVNCERLSDITFGGESYDCFVSEIST